MKAIIEALRALWGVLTDIGAAQAISGVVVSSALTTWSYIQGAKTSELIFVAIATFCCVFVFYNSARFVYREYKQYPDYKAWDRVSAPAIWQIACLWAGQRPYNHIGAETKAYPYLQALKNDIASGLLPVTEIQEELLWRRASRESLIAYAEERGERPPFLFPDER